MKAADPTYPLYPIACILTSAMLILVLTTSFARQSWNLGVAFLCFWLLLENFNGAVNAIIWSDNADVKLYVYCDIVTHIEEITFFVKPMSTLIITRRLYSIASLQSVEYPSRAARHLDLAIEWTLGLIIPIVLSGPIYYVNQTARFQVYEGSGCGTAEAVSILQLLTAQFWSVIPPLVSIIFYYPKVARTYYRQRRDINSFLHSNSSVSRTSYLRILILASIDILLTLPISIVNLTLSAVEVVSLGLLTFYPGWTVLHADWTPRSVPYAELQAQGTAGLVQNYVSIWSSPVLAFVIFALFGITPDARESYWRLICTIGGWFGWKPAPRTRNGQASLGEIEFGARPVQETSGIDLEMGSRAPSFIDAEMHAANQGAGHAFSGSAPREDEKETDLKSDEETRHDCTGDAISQGFIEDHAQAVEGPFDIGGSTMHELRLDSSDVTNGFVGDTTSRATRLSETTAV